MTSPRPAFMLSTLNENVKYMLDGSFNFPRRALNELKAATFSFLREAPLDTIFYLAPQAPLPETVQSQNTLLSILDSIVFGDTPLTTYHNECTFYSTINNITERLSAPYQSVLKNTLFKLQGIHYYLDIIDSFWNARHAFFQTTNKAYMASSMAVQLQCARAIRAEDNSLNLDSTSLILRLANLNIKPKCYFYSVSLTQSASDTTIALIGAFLISTEAENHTGDANPCVLYLPGTELQQFGSIALMKIYLATYLINPRLASSPLPACIALSQHSVMRNLAQRGGLDERNISLSPLSGDAHFFNNHIQSLIDQQKQNITYIWSQTTRPLPPVQPPEFVPRFWVNNSLFEFFSDTVQHRAIPALNDWRTHNVPQFHSQDIRVQPAPIPPGRGIQPLSPIKLYLVVHNDVTNITWTPWDFLGVVNYKPLPKLFTLESIKKDYFSWLIDELETISQRKVELTVIGQEIAPKLHNFEYVTENADTALDRWMEVVTEFLHRTAQPITPLDKFILLTRNEVVPGKISGISGGNEHTGSWCAIASLLNYQTAAHEIGHMLGATHEAGEIIYNGWWSETIMISLDGASSLRTNSYRFSNKNRENIKTYLSQFD